MKLGEYLQDISNATSYGEIGELRALAEHDLDLAPRSVLRVERAAAERREQITTRKSKRSK